MAYKRKLEEARKHRGEGGVHAYRRIKLLIEVWLDDDFRYDKRKKSDGPILDDFTAGEALKKEMSGLGFDFHNGQLLMEHYPEEKQWEDGLLDEMLDDIQAEMNENRQPPIQSSVERRTVTCAQFDSLLSEKKDAEYKVKTLEQALKKTGVSTQPLVEQIDKLEKKVSRLERENERLKLKIESREGELVEV